MSRAPSALYSETLLAHNRAPRGQGPLADASHRAAADNRHCGDHIEIALRVSGDTIEAAAFTGECCAITTAAASMLCSALPGRGTPSIQSLRDALLTGFTTGELPTDEFGFHALAELKHYPARQGCALLPFAAAMAALASGAHVISFRTATLDDIPAIVPLVESAYRGDSSRQGWTTEADLLDGQRIDAAGVRHIIANPNSRVLLAFRGAALIACVQVEAMQSVGYFGMFSVDPKQQGDGIGKALLSEAERVVFQDFGCTLMTCTVITVRQELIAWYERRGYRATGQKRPFPYGDERFGLPKRQDLEFAVFAKPLP